MFKKIITLFLAFVLVFSLSFNSFANVNVNEKIRTRVTKIKDIKESDWFYDAVKSMIERGIITGYSDNTFRPSKEVNRVEFSTMMVRALKLPVDKKLKESSFDDIRDKYWGIPYIEAAKYYLTGYKSGDKILFKPLQSAVREDMAVALVKALKYDITDADLSVLDRFIDKDRISKNLRPYVAIAVQKKLMQGQPAAEEGKFEFKPQSDVTRAVAAKLLLNVINEEKIVFDTEEKIVFETEDLAVLDEENKEEIKDEEKDLIRTPKVDVEVEDGYVKVEWEKISKEGLKGYKVVASINNENPKYPEDGYMYWITNLDQREAKFDLNTKYNGGDFEGEFVAGNEYYISVTAYYEDEKVPGNAVKIKMPALDEKSDEDKTDDE